MGACCSSKGHATYIYNGKRLTFQGIPLSLSTLREMVKQKLNIKDFEIYIGKHKIESDSEYKKYIQQRTDIEITIKDIEKQVETTKGNHKTELKKREEQKEVKENFCQNIPKDLKYFQSVVKGHSKIEITTLLAENGYVFIPDCFIQDTSLELFLVMKHNKKDQTKLRYVNTFNNFRFYKIFNTEFASSFEGISSDFTSSEVNEVSINGSDFSLNRTDQSKNIYSCKTPVFESSTVGDLLFSSTKCLGAISRILDHSTVELTLYRELVEIASLIRLFYPVSAMPSRLRNLEEYSAFSGKVIDENNCFLLNWIALDPDFIIIPRDYLSSPSLSLSIELHDQTVRLKRVEINENEDYFGSYNYYIFKLENPLNVLPDGLVSEPKSSYKLLFEDEQFDLKLLNESQDKYFVNEYIDHMFYGFPIFSHGKVGGIILEVDGHEAIILQVSKFKDILNKTKERASFKIQGIGTKKKSNKNQTVARKYPNIDTGKIKFENTPEFKLEEEEEDIIVPSHRRDMEEAAPNESFSGEIDIDIPREETSVIQNFSPENYSYGYINGRILRYNHALFRPQEIGKSLNVKNGYSFTSSPKGLIYVVGNIALNVTDGGENLPDLHSKHYFHSAVWHNNSIYIISGTDNTTTEHFDFGENEWVVDDPLPESREYSGSCSTGEYIYLMGGERSGDIKKTIFRFGGNWEEIKVNIPMALKSFGVIWDDGKFMLFGGRGKSILSDSFYVLDVNLKHTTTGELKVRGNLSLSSIGYMNGVYSVIISENDMIEYSDGLFKQVTV